MSLFCCWRALDIWDVGSWELESDTSCHAFWHGTECPHIPGQPSQQPQIPHVTTLCQPGASGRHSRKASLSFFPHDNTSEQAAEAAEATKSWRGGRVQSAWDQKGSKFRKQYSSTRWSSLLEEKDCCIGGRHGVREAGDWQKIKIEVSTTKKNHVLMLAVGDGSVHQTSKRFYLSNYLLTTLSVNSSNGRN